MNNDGTELNYFMEDYFVQSIGLAIDFAEDRLYWFSADGASLESAKIDDPSNTIVR